jgi:hypothetical protein
MLEAALEGGLEAAAAVQEWLTARPAVIIAVGAFSAAAFFGTLAAVPLVVIRIPADYFLRPERYRVTGGSRGWRAAVLTVKNLAGAVFLLAGIAMLVLPGQGLLTILIALMLLDFPGKRRMERAVVSKPKVLRAVNALRKRAGRKPLRIESGEAPRV